jgi:hypothetical protein
MTRAESLLVLAMLAQMVLTVLVGFWLGRTRALAIKAKAITGDVMLSGAGWPAQAKAASNNFSNQFEVPVLFYALALLALHLHLAGLGLAVLAWIFVVGRVSHSIAHCSTNEIRYRAPPYFVALFAVIAMLVVVTAGVVSAL